MVTKYFYQIRVSFNWCAVDIKDIIQMKILYGVFLLI